MTPTDAKMLADLDAAEALATKGPWETWSTEVHTTIDDGSGTRLLNTEFDMVRIRLVEAQANAAFIAAARNALPRLLTLVREQDAALRHAAVVACAPSARIGIPMADALSGLRKALDSLVPGWNADGLKALGVTR